MKVSEFCELTINSCSVIIAEEVFWRKWIQNQRFLFCQIDAVAQLDLESFHIFSFGQECVSLGLILPLEQRLIKLRVLTVFMHHMIALWYSSMRELIMSICCKCYLVGPTVFCL